MAGKTYTVVKSKSNSDKSQEISGTLEELAQHFSGVLYTGHDLNDKIKTEFKDIKAFMNNLQKAYKVIESGVFAKTWIDLKE